MAQNGHFEIEDAAGNTVATASTYGKAQKYIQHPNSPGTHINTRKSGYTKSE